jgi:hypothetical protein
LRLLPSKCTLQVTEGNEESRDATYHCALIAEMVEAVNKKKEEKTTKTEEKEFSSKTNIDSDLVEVFA